MFVVSTIVRLKSTRSGAGFHTSSMRNYIGVNTRVVWGWITRIVVSSRKMKGFAMEVPVIETERLLLRGHRLDDFEALAAMWADPAVVRFIGGKPSVAAKLNVQ